MRALIERFQSEVFGLCVRLLTHRHDAEDVTQETFLRVFRSLRRWDATPAVAAVDPGDRGQPLPDLDVAAGQAAGTRRLPARDRGPRTDDSVETGRRDPVRPARPAARVPERVRVVPRAGPIVRGDRRSSRPAGGDDQDLAAPDAAGNLDAICVGVAWCRPSADRARRQPEMTDIEPITDPDPRPDVPPARPRSSGFSTAKPNWDSPEAAAHRAACAAVPGGAGSGGIADATVGAGRRSGRTGRRVLKGVIDCAAPTVALRDSPPQARPWRHRSRSSSCRFASGRAANGRLGPGRGRPCAASRSEPAGRTAEAAWRFSDEARDAIVT